MHYPCQNAYHPRCLRELQKVPILAFVNQKGCPRCRLRFHVSSIEAISYAAENVQRSLGPLNSDSDNSESHLDEENSVQEKGDSAVTNQVSNSNEGGSNNISGGLTQSGLEQIRALKEAELDLMQAVKEAGGHHIDALAEPTKTRQFEDEFRPRSPHADYVDVVLHNSHICPNFGNDRVANDESALLRSSVPPSLLVSYATFYNSLMDFYFDDPITKLNLGEAGPAWIPVTPDTIDDLDVPIGLRIALRLALVREISSSASPPVLRRHQRLWMTFKPERGFVRTGRLIKSGPVEDPEASFQPFHVPKIEAVLLELRTSRAYQQDVELGLFEDEGEYELGYRVEWQQVWEVTADAAAGFQQQYHGHLCGTRVLGHGLWGHQSHGFSNYSETAVAARARTEN